ncbi:proline--tRNA ligase [Paenibacillus sp. IB182496]|uniref:Proline--tRNA ligase n=1 Tax=Paenibacillus sabuli TaxID=2772509 RepID=A0A927BVK6_9BACL|nr:proline--tRNA ligase [Paenibacillus sabuli]MBD2847646.1 proline--tRNA ligase [Paenibacillus sabuli]
MRQSQLFATTLREEPADAELASHRLLLKAGYIRQLAGGIYTYMPLGWRVLQKIESIVNEEMDRAGAQRLLMPALQPLELWQASGRERDYGPELIRLRDRHDREFALGPTHEEVIASLVGNELQSYRRFPVTLYQIQTKFRDERRPRYGLLRGREFLMKDAYSFDTDREGLDRSYQRMYEAYERIFTRCGLDYRAVEADAGAIGGDGGSHEFVALSESGEDTIASCSACGYAANVELSDVSHTATGDACPRCMEGGLQLCKGIEVGHVFKLGTKYTEALGALYLDANGRERASLMGCYGIGISRLMAAVLEQHHDASGMVWPAAVAPYAVHIVIVAIQDARQRECAERLYEQLRAHGIDVLLDDRDERAGVKFRDADLLGLPHRIVAGKHAQAGSVEYVAHSSGIREVLTIEEAAARVVARCGRRFAP